MHGPTWSKQPGNQLLFIFLYRLWAIGKTSPMLRPDYLHCVCDEALATLWYCLWDTLHIIGASLSEPHTSVTALCMCVCISKLVCLDRALTVDLNEHIQIFHNDGCPHRRVLQQTSEQKPWRRAWRATARLQGCREREQEWRQFKLNALAAWTATLWTMVRVWRSRDKPGYEWPWPMTIRQQDVRWLQVRA